MWHTGQPIPTNIITGFLGTGKTTAILELLKCRPAGERWSVFVNEYGMVSIDDVLMESKSQDVQIQELAGGCFCCTTSAMMDTVLMQFIRRTKPDRLLIEPSGAGHPARVIDALR
ncbi:MAG: cobalamin biosynthesis protein CobW, partial [Planctomycetota bacterium]